MFSDAGIPTFDTPEDAVHASLQIVHYRRAQGVLMQVPPAAPGDLAVEAMHQPLSRLQPGARLRGFSVQAMVRRAQAHELIVGVTTDPVFGPVILFGQGGVAVKVSADHAVGLPPLNMVLARDMVSRTRISKLPSGYRNRPKAVGDAICRTLIQVARLVIDVPEIAELDINPLLANAQGVIALDARMRVTVSPISRRPCSCRPAGEQDDITTPEQVFRAAALVGTTPGKIVKKLVPGGHIGLFMGTQTLRIVWPGVTAGS